MENFFNAAKSAGWAEFWSMYPFKEGKFYAAYAPGHYPKYGTIRKPDKKTLAVVMDCIGGELSLSKLRIFLRKNFNAQNLDDWGWPEIIEAAGQSATANNKIDDTPKPPTPAIKRAYQQYEAAAAAGNSTDKQCYTWVKDNAEPDDYLPDEKTWIKYVQRGRAFYNNQKNTRRAGRTGKSIVNQSDI